MNHDIDTLHSLRYTFYKDTKGRLFQIIDTGESLSEDKITIVVLRHIDNGMITEIAHRQFVQYLNEKSLIQTEIKAV